MFCPKCGYQYNYDYCIQCRYKPQEYFPNQKKQTKSQSILNIIKVILTGLSLSISFIVLLPGIYYLFEKETVTGISLLITAIAFAFPFISMKTRGGNKRHQHTIGKIIVTQNGVPILETAPIKVHYKPITQQISYNQTSDTQNPETIEYSYKTVSIPLIDLLLMKIDSLSTSGVYFENVLCEILEVNGFTNIETTKVTNDNGIDVLAEKDGITYAIQCKCYSSTVGNKSVQEAYTGKGFYHRMVAVVATNSTFSKSAIETAKTTQVLLWDRNKLIDMIKKATDAQLEQLISMEL